MAAVFAHEFSDIKPQTDIRNELDVNLLLKFYFVRFPNRARRSAAARARDQRLLELVEERWPEEYFEKLKTPPLYTGNQFRLSQFTIRNLHTVMTIKQIPMTQMFLARYNAAINPMDAEQAVKADARRFNAALIADPAQPTILRFVACMNKAVQMMAQSLGHFRLGIRTLVEYWAEKDFIEYKDGENDQTWWSIRMNTMQDASRKVQLEHTIAKQLMSGAKKLQTFDRSNMQTVGWDNEKTNALQYFCIAMQLLKECLENPPDTLVEEDGGNSTFEIPNPERVEFNRLLYANIGYSIPNNIENDLLMKDDDDDDDMYYVVYDINDAEYDEDAKEFIRNNFKRKNEVLRGGDDDNEYIGRYFGYKFKDGLSFSEAEPFMPRSRIVEAIIRDESAVVRGDRMTQDLARQATMEAVRESVYGDQPNANFTLTPMPRGRALKEAIETYFIAENEQPQVYELKGFTIDTDFEVPDEGYWVTYDSIIRIGNDDARRYLQHAVKTLQDSAPRGPNNPPWLQFKPSNSWNTQRDANVVFGNTPSMYFPANISFKESIEQLLNATPREQAQLFRQRGVTYQYGAPNQVVDFDADAIASDEDSPLRRASTPPGAMTRSRASGNSGGSGDASRRMTRSVTESMGLRMGLHALPGVYAQMARIADGDMEHARVIDLLVSPQEVNDYLDATLHKYNDPDHRLVRQFAHKMGWREGGVISLQEKAE